MNAAQRQAHNDHQREAVEDLQLAPFYGTAANMDLDSPPSDVLEWIEDTSTKRFVTKAVKRIRAKGLDVITVDVTPWLRTRAGRSESERRWTLAVYRDEYVGVGDLLITERRKKVNGRIVKVEGAFGYSTRDLVVALGLDLSRFNDPI